MKPADMPSDPPVCADVLCSIGGNEHELYEQHVEVERVGGRPSPSRRQEEVEAEEEAEESSQIGKEPED